jgi:molybdopterin/thiamine biosynthesis adenylyltransferase
MRNTFSTSKSIPVVCHSKPLKRKKGEESVTTAQEGVPGFDQCVLSRSTIILIGVGGVGSQVALALARKGVGKLTLVDHDIVEPSNLPRQVYYPKDVGKPKAYALAGNLAREGFLDQAFSGYHLSFQDAIARGIDLSADIAIVGVDSNPGRIAASTYYRERGVPVLFSAVSRAADQGYVFVQEPEGPCFGCQFPGSINDRTSPCPGTPAILDILKVVAGIAAYAVDSLLMPRARHWNYKAVYLATSGDCTWTIARRPDCKLCGAAQDEPQLLRFPDSIGVPSGQIEGRL